MKETVYEILGLTVVIDKIEYEYNPSKFSWETPHGFHYFISIYNNSGRTITLLARKWIIREAQGKITVVEGDKIVGFTPTLKHGQRFSYNSCHVVKHNARAYGTFHGIDEMGKRIFTRIPTFGLIVPQSEEDIESSNDEIKFN